MIADHELEGPQPPVATAKTSATKTSGVKYLLEKLTHPDLAAVYNPGMEVQCSVAQDGGEEVELEYQGTRYKAFTDGRTTWKSFRIPRDAKTEPVDNDGPLNFDLEAHVEGIGLTGWDFKNKVSKYVGFDYDDISGHANGLTDAELAEVKKKAMEIPWVTVRKSTSGRGLHLYVFLPDVPTANHDEHAALAHAVLDQMSAMVGFNFSEAVDCAGHILWFWHRKMRGTGLALLKQGEIFRDIPPDWRDSTPKQRRTMPRVEDNQSDRDRLFDEMTGSLEAGHRQLIDYLADNRWAAEWDGKRLSTHTVGLKRAHAALGLRGTFETVSLGRRPQEANAFAYPRQGGGWVVRRYGQGVTEASTWRTERGWTTCYLGCDEPRLPGLPGSGFALGLVSSAEFFSKEYLLDWLVEDVLVADETAAIGGPSKSSKSSTQLDLFISLATATSFLGRFRVPKPRRVALISGESGRRVIQEGARSVCRGRGLSVDRLSNILWGFRVPQFSDPEHLTVLRKTIDDNGIEVIGIDPFYLALGGGVDAKNMFEMGPILAEIAETCLGAGATPIIAHHFTKFRPNPYGPPELSEFSHAGFGQYIRQWMLLAPRERYDAERGLFKLHFNFGGSAGQSGEYALDIEVGKLGVGSQRKWEVTVSTPGEVIADKRERAAQEQADKEAVKASVKAQKERKQMREAVAVFRENGNRGTGKTLRESLGCSGDTAARILYLLESEGNIRKPESGRGYELIPGHHVVA